MKEHSSQGRGILAALLLAVFAGFNLNAADAKFIVAAKGQRWMQTNSSAATLIPGTNHAFMVSVDANGPESVTNGFLVLPNASVLPLTGDGDDHGGLEELFVSQSTMDVAFPNGTYQVVVEGVNDGSRTNAVAITGDSYPSTPHFDAFAAAQAIDPTVDFNLTWEPISGATVNDYVGIEVVDCTDEEVAFSPQPGDPNALNGTSTSFVIRARSLRPGMKYKVKMIVGHFSTYSTESYPGAIVAGGYLKELFMPMTTTGTPVDCPPGRLQMVFNFPAGGFDQTNGAITFPQALANYVVQLDVRHETNPPASIAFSGPAGSGLNTTTNAHGNSGDWGAWFVSPQIPLPPYPPAGVYVVHYGGNNWNYNLLDPNAAGQQTLIIPTVVLNESSEVQEVRWRYAGTNGISIDAPIYVEGVSLSLDSMFGPLYQSGWYGEPLSRSTTSHALAFPVPWEAVTTVNMFFHDIAKNTFVSSFHRDSGPPPGMEIVTQELPGGVVGQTYGVSLSVNGGQGPYLWTVSAGSLPEGLNLSPDTGNIIGHPAAPGTREFLIRVTDSTDAFAERSIFITIQSNGGGGEPHGPDVRFFAVLKGQRWMQTNAGPAVAADGGNYMFMSFVEGNGGESLLAATLVPPGSTPRVLEDTDGENFELQQTFVSKDALDELFPNGDYAVLTEGAFDGSRTNQLLVTGDAYPAAPQISNFTAAQAINPAADFTVSWAPISGATENDYVSFELYDCQDETILSTGPPGSPDALTGTATNFLIRARTLRPGQQYKVKFFVGRFTTFNTNDYPGATGIAGYVSETHIPLATTGTPVDCAAGRVGFVFNFPTGGFDGTNGTIAFPTGLDHYALHYEVRGETNPPATITFTGPVGSGLSSSTNGDAYADGHGAWFSSPLVNVPPFPPGGVYTINYGGNNRSFNLLDPNAAAQQVLLVPTVIVDNEGSVTELRWRHADTNGTTVSPPTFVENVSVTFQGSQGPLYQIGYGDEPLPGDAGSHVLYYPVPWNQVLSVQLIFRDAAANSFISTWNREVTPPPAIAITTMSLPPGIVGTNYSFALEATGGEPPYQWTVRSGDLPPGLELNGDTGEITGVPEAGGRFNVTFRVIDIFDELDEKSFVLTVSGGGGSGTGPEVREIVLFKGQEFMQTGAGAPVPGTNQPFHFEAFVEGSYWESITNVVLRSPKGTNYPMMLEDLFFSSLAATGAGDEDDGGGDGGTFRIEGRFPTKNALDAVFNSGNYQFQITTGGGSNRTANLNLPGDNYPATPHIANWAAAQSIDAFADFTLTWDALAGGTTNDLVMVEIEGEFGTIFETEGPGHPEALNGKSTSVLIPTGTLEPGQEYKCGVFLAKLVTTSTNAYPGAKAMAAYAKATFILLNTVTPPPVEGQFQFSASTFTVSETNSTAEFTITRTGGSEGAVSVDFSTADGTAVADLDYVPTEGVLEFADGETSVTFTFEIIDDQIFETNETIRLSLSNPQGGAALGSQTNAVMIVTDNDTPGSAGLLQFSAASYVVGENSATVTLTVTRTGGKAGEVTVDYLTVDGDALGEADFTPDFGTLTFEDGVTSQTIVIGLNNDDLDETNETFQVMLDAPGGGASLGTRNAASVVITDNDSAGEIKFSVASSKADETDGEAVVTLTRSGGTAEGVTVEVTVTGGTATTDEDYSLMSETVEFAAGETTATLSLLINDDSDPEGDETVLLQLSNPTGGATLGKGTNATILIVDDEVTFQFSAESYTVNESSPTVVLTVTRSGPTTGTSTVDFSTTDGTGVYGSAYGGIDFDTAFGTVTFGPGVTSRTVPIRVIRDNLAEEDKTFDIQLSGPIGGQLGNISEAEVTIVDDDVGGELNFKVVGFTVKESAPVAVVVVTRTGGDAAGVTFDFTTEDGSAEDGDDYTGVTETIEFGAGANAVKIEIPLLGDALDETNETVQLSISNPTGGATLGELDAATLTIIDDDTGGVIAFSAATYSITETGATATVTLTRSGGKAGGVSVDVINMGGTATADEDYTDFDGTTVTFDENETKVTFTIDITDDSDADGNETVLLALDNPTGGARLGSRTNAVLNIQDDERSLQFSVAETNVVEGVRSVVLTVTRSGPLKGAITVQYATADDSATAGSDYTAKSGTLSFSSGSKSKTITIPLLNDTASESEEAFTVTLSNPTSGVVIGSNSEVTVTIQDNDLAPRVGRAARR